MAAVAMNPRMAGTRTNRVGLTAVSPGTSEANPSLLLDRFGYARDADQTSDFFLLRPVGIGSIDFRPPLARHCKKGRVACRGRSD
jgi:hypothetical protein